MSKVLQHLLYCFNGTTSPRFLLAFIFSCSVFAQFSWFACGVFSVILTLYLKVSDFVMWFAL